MSFRAIILFTLLAVPAFAKQPRVRQAWANTYAHQSLSIISDNIGHIVVFGSEIDEYGTPTNSAPMSLLNSRGKAIASVDGIAGRVTADTAGRIFVLSSELQSLRLRCTAFAPLLSQVLWSNEREIPNGRFGSFADTHRLLPDETGGADVFGSVSVLGNLEFFVVPFSEANTAPAVFWYSQPPNYSRVGMSAARDANRIIHCIGRVSAFYASGPIFLTYVPGSTELNVSQYLPTPTPTWWFNTIACDAASDLVLGGAYEQDAFYRPISQCLIEKQSSDLRQKWRVTHPAGYFASVRFLRIDREANIVVICSHGVTKYSPDGMLLWQVRGTFLKCEVDRFGNVFLAEENTNEFGLDTPLIVKLAANGQRLWEAALYDSQPTESSYVSGLVCDDEGGVYVSSADLVTRFVENGPKPRDERIHPFVRPQKR